MSIPMPGVYILQSLKNMRYYIGSTENVDSRLIMHNNGKVKATKFLTPWTLKFFQPCSNITVAKQLEYALKKLKRRDIIEGIIREQKIYGKLAQMI
jgi:putative endonuclease